MGEAKMAGHVRGPAARRRGPVVGMPRHGAGADWAYAMGFGQMLRQQKEDAKQPPGQGNVCIYAWMHVNRHDARFSDYAAQACLSCLSLPTGRYSLLVGQS